MKFFSALCILLLAIFLQLFFASTGWYFNLALAVLITLAFVLDQFVELLLVDLVAVFILNWQPAPSGTLILFALIPLVAFAFRKLIHSEQWIGNLAAIFFGFSAFYIIAAPSFFIGHFWLFLPDVVVAMAVGELVLVVLS